MRIAITNFTGGEVAPSLSARYDLNRYGNSVQCMENFLPNVHGNVERRPGLRFIADLGTGVENDAVLFPFSFNVEAEQNFVLILTHNRLRVAQGDALLTHVDMPSPWAAQDLAALTFAQVGDIVYFAHKNYPLHKIMRSGTAPQYKWMVQKVVLNTSLAAPSMPSLAFTGEANDYALRYKIVAVDTFGKESLPSQAGTVQGRHPSDWVQGNRVTISWPAVPEAVEYNIYREEAGYFGFIGISSSLTFVDNNYEADISDTPKEDWDPFAGGNNPGVVSFHQQRMVLAATPQSPQAFYMSRVGDFENFRKSRPLQDDDPIEYHIASGNIDAITWAASFGDLLLGTAGSEYKVSGEGAAITASNVFIMAQSYWGSSHIFPIVIGNSIVHVQRHGARVRDLFYSLEKDGYAGNDLSIMAPHLFDGQNLRQWAYQQSPYSSIWIVRDDGVLLALTYMKEHDIWGWSRHCTQGKVRSVVTVTGKEGDEIYAVVQRRVQKTSVRLEAESMANTQEEEGTEERFYLEKLASRWQELHGIAEAFFMDSGITFEASSPTQEITSLEHLEGCAVSVLADGSPMEGLTVQNGKIFLPYAARKVHVGLAYASRLSPLPAEGETAYGTSLGQMRGIGACTVRIQQSVGGKYGASPDMLFDFPFVPTMWGEAVKPFSGDIDFIPGGGQGTQSSLWLVQERPLPFTVGAVIMQIDM